MNKLKTIIPALIASIYVSSVSAEPLNDQNYMTILLSHLKELTKNMTVAITEASHEKLYKDYKKMYDALADAQRKSYELMFYLGWYSLEKATDTKIDNLASELQTQLDNLEN